MPKKFNITGTCHPGRHYMADNSEKLRQIRALIEEGAYFTINRPRQYGKTTTLASMARLLHESERYLVFNISFEGLGSTEFSSPKDFCSAFLHLLERQAKSQQLTEVAAFLKAEGPRTERFLILSGVITDLVGLTGKRVVLLIDEVDKSSNNQLFLDFLATLRTKFLNRDDPADHTFHAVVLAGVHDVKSLKAKLRPQDEAKQNSPWNIATEFKVGMSLMPHEIAPMLEDFAQEQGVQLDAAAMADRLYYYTSGYPFLVSKLCKTMAEDLLPAKAERALGEVELEQAVQLLLKENNTNFDSLIKNLENNPELYRLAFELIISGAEIPYNPDEPVAALGRLYGIFRQNGRLRIHNRIYEQRLYNYMAAKALNEQLSSQRNPSSARYAMADGRLDLEQVLIKFRQYLKEQHSKKDEHFLERQWRLVFLAFLKPIINGRGHDFKEVQISEEKRLDVAVTYNQYKYIIELKRWYGPKAHQAGLAQLADYLDRQGLDEGYLVIFDPRRVKTIHESAQAAQEWIEIEGKRVFVVWV